jgi:predicted acetyltransferase
MTTSLSLLNTRDEALTRSLHDIVGHAFGLPPEDVGRWFERAGHEHVRTFVRGEREVVGGLLEIPMGQFFGGVSIPTLGVAGVAVATAERGKGIGAQMMVAMLRSAKTRGFPISSLYPASVTLYRRAGYERAGARFVTCFDPRHIEIARERSIAIGEAEGIPDELRAMYNRTARRSQGYFDRGPYCWARVVSPRGMRTKTFVASHSGKAEGYVVLGHVMPPDGFPTKVNVTDLEATTPRAARALLRLLIEYRSLTDVVKWEGGVNDLFATVLPERHITATLKDYFMVRIVDPARAFSLRRFPDGAFTFELADTSMPENSGRYAVTSRDGNTTVTVGGLAGPVVKLDERALSALYTGFTQPEILADAGWLETPDPAALRPWFLSTFPTMRDHF